MEVNLSVRVLLMLFLSFLLLTVAIWAQGNGLWASALLLNGCNGGDGWNVLIWRGGRAVRSVLAAMGVCNLHRKGWN